MEIIKTEKQQTHTKIDQDVIHESTHRKAIYFNE